MEFIPTNDVFHHFLNILQLRDKDEIIALFASQGLDVSRAKLKSWSIKTGLQAPSYRPMPRDALDAFIDALYAKAHDQPER